MQPGQVKIWLLDFVRDQLISFYKQDTAITGARVSFREQDSLVENNKICEIELTIYGNNIIASRGAASYNMAVKEVLAVLDFDVQQHLQEQKEPPDIVVSTVKV